MQFKVPQNIDLEDRIVGPLTLLQFIYLLVGGLVDYILFQLLSNHLVIFWLIGLPIGLLALAMAFLKIQDQPLIHFVQAGLDYLNRPKTRYWQRLGKDPVIIDENLIRPKKVEAKPLEKHIEKSNLEQLAHVLDTGPMNQEEERYFGKITAGFEKLLKKEDQTQPNQQSNYIAPRQSSGQGGNFGALGQTQNTNAGQYARNS